MKKLPLQEMRRQSWQKKRNEYNGQKITKTMAFVRDDKWF